MQEINGTGTFIISGEKTTLCNSTWYRVCNIYYNGDLKKTLGSFSSLIANFSYLVLGLALLFLLSYGLVLLRSLGSDEDILVVTTIITATLMITIATIH